MLDSIAPHTVENVWQKHESAPEGEADPMSYEAEQELSHVAKTNLTFLDIVDAINPLQHIPVISSIYRNISGDNISDVPKFVGGALYGGPIGLVAALGSYIIEAESTKTQAPKKGPDLAANNDDMKQREINTAKDETFEVLGEKKTSHSTHSLKNAVARKTFLLASEAETFATPNDAFKSGKVYSMPPRNVSQAREVRGLVLDKLIQNTSKTYTSENFNRNDTKTANHVITDHRDIENWMLEKLGKYNKLQNTK
ncbi:MAG: hypothetical protein CMM43_05855 [Rhodospirillaceae bacterium]|nr:hypothetical protein [Rhodospirillaceae bacterium]